MTALILKILPDIPFLKVRAWGVVGWKGRLSAIILETSISRHKISTELLEIQRSKENAPTYRTIYNYIL
jgi:hypothetical protein